MSKLHPNILYYDMNIDYPNIESGKGIYLYDTEGNAYIDACGGAISTSLAHGREDMAKVLYEQAKKIAYVHRDQATAPVVNRAADKLHEVFAMDRFFLVSGGSEATEIATKIARYHFVKSGKPQKSRIIGRWMSYHGYTTEPLAFGGNPARRSIFMPYLREDGKVPPPYCYRCWYGKECGSCNFECARALENEILMYGAENTAAFICEPVSGTSLACAVPPEGYFRVIREICDKYDVLFVVDEVMCGSGRTGTWTAIEQFGVKPDIIALAKSIGGGYMPIGAAACTKEVAEPIVNGGGFGAGFTWSGSPLAAAVALKTINVIQEEKLLDNVIKQGVYLHKKLEELKEKHPSIGDVRGRGLMWGIEFVKNKKTKECFPKELNFGQKLEELCREHYMFVLCGARFDRGVQGDGILLGPNFQITSEELDKIVGVLEDVVTELERQESNVFRAMEY